MAYYEEDPLHKLCPVYAHLLAAALDVRDILLSRDDIASKLVGMVHDMTTEAFYTRSRRQRPGSVM
jgi:hypothetical protein